MRTTKELLEIVLYELENGNLFKSGLCPLYRDMQINSIIDANEFNELIYYSRTHYPEKKYDLLYIFPSGEKEPRVAWVKEQISKL